jgi:hypothetical protein
VKSAFPIASVFLILATARYAHAADPAASDGPTERSLDRYTHIWTAKPFVAATVVTPQAESVVQRYAITGYAQFGGSDVLFLLDRTTLSRFTVTEQKPDSGVELLAVTEKDDANHLKARIRAGGEVAEVAYDAAATGMPTGGDNPAMAAVGNPNSNPAGASPPALGGPAPNQVAGQRRTVAAPRPVRVIQRRPPIKSQ